MTFTPFIRTGPCHFQFVVCCEVAPVLSVSSQPALSAPPRHAEVFVSEPSLEPSLLLPPPPAALAASDETQPSQPSSKHTADD